ncbi:hypothetical protein AB0O04_37090 [Streptomyces althioticus]|uniref:hypothetical protein n=1 Tax=Streptomyces althioticus TaxID=83380 RepID=UPI00341E7989
MPYVPQDVLDRLAALEREVRQLRGRAQIRPALNQINHGRVVIGEGGTLEVHAPDGTGLFGVGEFAPYYNHVDGSPQQGVVMQREDGTTAFTVRAVPSVLGIDTQTVAMWDRAGNGVLADDSASGLGLGSPALPLPFQKMPAGGEEITGTAFEQCWFAGVQRMNPIAAVHLELGVAPGATGEARVQYRRAVESEWSVVGSFTASTPSSAGSAQYTTRWITFPLDRADFEDVVFVRVQARRSAGSGGVICNSLGGYTRRTYDASEIPDPPAAAAATFAARAVDDRADRAATVEGASGEGTAPPEQPSPLIA